MKYANWLGALALVATLSTASDVQAQSVPPNTGDAAPPHILITGSRTPLPSNRLGRAHTVIDRQALVDSGARTVAETLRRVPGIAVSRAGGSSGKTQLRLRGAEANHVLVLIDGIEVSDPNHDEFSWEGLAVDDIQTIEIIRGPQSALWGANALAGVISITTVATPSGPAPADSGLARFEAGSGSSGRLHVSERFDIEESALTLSTTHHQERGFDMSESGGERDGLRSASHAVGFRGTLSNATTIGGTLRYLGVRTETDPTNPAFSGPDDRPVLVDGSQKLDRREWFAGGSITYAPAGRLHHTPRVEVTSTERSNDIAGTADSAWRNQRFHASYQLDMALDGRSPERAGHVVSAVAEWERTQDDACLSVFGGADCLLAAPQFIRRERILRALAAEYRGEFGEGTAVQGALRRDSNDAFQDRTTWSAAVSAELPEIDARVHAAAGTGVTNPTFDEQFGYFRNFTGNPELTPELSRGGDIGIEWSPPALDLTADATFFVETLENEIVQGFGPPPDFRLTLDNAEGKSKRSGLELSLAAHPAPLLSLQASYTYVDSRDGNQEAEIRRPQHTGSLRVNYLLASGQGSLFLDATYTGEQEDTDFRVFRRVTLDATTLVTVGGSFKLNDRTSIEGRVENLLGKRPEEVVGYLGTGREAFVGMTTRF